MRVLLVERGMFGNIIQDYLQNKLRCEMDRQTGTCPNPLAEYLVNNRIDLSVIHPDPIAVREILTASKSGHFVIALLNTGSSHDIVKRNNNRLRRAGIPWIERGPGMDFKNLLDRFQSPD